MRTSPRNPPAWVPAFPEPTGVGSGIPGTHAPRNAWVRSNQSSEPTRFWSFIFRGFAGRRSSVLGVLGVSGERATHNLRTHQRTHLRQRTHQRTHLRKAD